MNKEILYSYIFHFNPYSEVWEATSREHYEELFSGDKGNVLKSKDYSTLVQLILKTNGEKDAIDKLVEEPLW